MQRRTMRGRFLAGHDEVGFLPPGGYATIDADVGLDDYWARLVEQDQEEAYFGAD